MLAALFLGLGLCILAYQDFSERLISWWTIPWVLFAALYLAVVDPLWEASFLFFNAVFLLIQLLGISLYFSIKQKAWVKITQAHLGIGDILFFIAICPLFAPVHFILFFVGSLILILIGALLYQVAVKKMTSIPLAGAMSLCLMFYHVSLYQFNISPYNDWQLLQFIYG